MFGVHESSAHHGIGPQPFSLSHVTLALEPGQFFWGGCWPRVVPWGPSAPKHPSAEGQVEQARSSSVSHPWLLCLSFQEIKMHDR